MQINVYINTNHHYMCTCTCLAELSVQMCGLVADGVVEHTAVGIIQTLDLQTERETDAEIRRTDAG